jgi:aminoglycoside 6'-N-acetyltransferase I
MRIRPFINDDWSTWRRMSQALFPDFYEGESESDMHAFLARVAANDAALLIAERDDGSTCGFVEVATRPYADGCSTSPVGYIEAWFVDADMRRRGVGRALLDAAEDWARSLGLHEMASVALLDNEVSHEAHRRSGYIEVERAIRYRKPL